MQRYQRGNADGLPCYFALNPPLPLTTHTRHLEIDVTGDNHPQTRTLDSSLPREPLVPGGLHSLGDPPSL